MKQLQKVATVGALMVGLGTMLAGSIGCSKSNSPDNQGAGGGRLDGAGSSFVKPIMTKWVSEYNKEKGVQIDYKSGGSGAGIQQMTNKTVAFGATDAPMDPNQLEEAKKVGGEVVHIPLVIGGAVAAYNLPEVQEPLKFTGPILADIFLGKITKWNDDALKKVNPGVNLPDRNIIVVVRSDPSGTNYIWTDYLSKVVKDWPLGVSVKVEWKTGETAKGSEGMAGKLKTPGTIGYVELLYVLQNKIQYGHIQNQEGEFIKPDLESVKIAAQHSLAAQPIPETLCYSLVNSPGKGAYPISGTTWAVLYAKQPPGTGQELVKFLRWVTHEGQKYCDALNYVQLPSVLVEKIDKKLDAIEFVK
jgi:phosphate transport system substrate-binding protein